MICHIRHMRKRSLTPKWSRRANRLCNHVDAARGSFRTLARQHEKTIRMAGHPGSCGIRCASRHRDASRRIRRSRPPGPIETIRFRSRHLLGGIGLQRSSLSSREVRDRTRARSHAPAAAHRVVRPPKECRTDDSGSRHPAPSHTTVPRRVRAVCSQALATSPASAARRSAGGSAQTRTREHRSRVRLLRRTG